MVICKVNYHNCNSNYHNSRIVDYGNIMQKQISGIYNAQTKRCVLLPYIKKLPENQVDLCNYYPHN